MNTSHPHVVPAITCLMRQDLIVAYWRRAQLANPLLFFVLVTSLFPLAIGPDSALLQKIAPGVLWVAALLAVLLSHENMFRSDFADGTLDLLLASPHPLSLLVLAKVMAHWIATGLPLLLIAPLLAVWLQLPVIAVPTLLATLILGTPVLSLIGAIGVALTIGLPRGGVLLALLILPLYIPVLIFATGAVDAATAGLVVKGQLAMLGALLILAVSLAPFAIAAALRISSG